MQTYKNNRQCTTILTNKNNFYPPDALILLCIAMFQLSRVKTKISHDLNFNKFQVFIELVIILFQTLIKLH